MKKSRNSGRVSSGKGYFRKKQTEGYTFISLWLAGILIFRMFPSLYSLVCSFSDFHLFGGIKKWGMMNYAELAGDPKIISSFAVTLKYTFITVPLKLLAALAAALLLNHTVRGMRVFRTLFYVPTVLGSSVAITVLWKALFRDDGLVNSFLSLFGADGVSWLSGPESALWVIAMLRVWQFGSCMVVFLAALKSVPVELYDAAAIDGAGRIRRFMSITFPFLTPVIFYNLVTQAGMALQEFNAPFIITQGGPRNATALISVMIYNTAFQKKDMGMACALTWIFMIIVSVISAAMFLSQKYWVFYSNDSQEDI